MTDTANAPERIQAWMQPNFSEIGSWSVTRYPEVTVEYVLATHCDELVAAAYVAASEKAWAIAVEMELHAAIGSTTKAKAEAIEGAILSGAPDNARAALTAYGERMKAEGAREAQAKIARLTEALKWYGEQARLCRLIHSEGDAGRNALNNDGGKRAAAALQENANE